MFSTVPSSSCLRRWAVVAVAFTFPVSLACATSGRTVATAPAATSPYVARSVPPPELAAAWDTERLPLPPAPLLRHHDIEAQVTALTALDPAFFTVEALGTSVEGRTIYHVAAGRGTFPVLLWSQMHGDEASATPALLDLLHYLHRHRDRPDVARMLSALRLHVVPMLNPDGAERFTRRNAQGIDINRDALRLQTPEGRLLKALRDRVQARLGFNLHNQNWRTAVGRPPKPATISILSVAYDEARSVDEGRLLTKKVCAVLRDALEPFIPGQIGRYDDEFEARAFGDNVTKWGTPVVLIESGPIGGEAPDLALTRLNFVGLFTALDAVSSGEVHAADPARYESLPENGSGLMHTIVRGGRVVPGTGVAPFTADVGIAGMRSVQERDGERAIAWTTRIDELGDLRTSGALNEIDAAGLVVAPLYDEATRPGTEVTLPDWQAAPARQVILPGQPARLLLLEDLGEGRYRVRQLVVPGG